MDDGKSSEGMKFLIILPKYGYKDFSLEFYNKNKYMTQNREASCLLIFNIMKNQAHQEHARSEVLNPPSTVLN